MKFLLPDKPPDKLPDERPDKRLAKLPDNLLDDSVGALADAPTDEQTDAPTDKQTRELANDLPDKATGLRARLRDSAALPRKRTRIQVQNETRIVAAALEVFATHGYRGSTVEQIAQSASMSKANVLYYFRKKQDIYAAVLERTLVDWLDPLDALDPEGDPIEELWQYARQKLHLSRKAPHASRLFANEILQGAPIIRPFLDKELKSLVARKCHIIQVWINDGKLAPISPLHLLFLIWSSTQHYADFDPQIQALSETSEDILYQQAEQTLKLILTRGLEP